MKNLVLLHGLVRTKYSMTTLAWYFKRQGYNILNIDYPSRKLHYSDLADYVFNKIAKQFSSEDELNFICHSLGSIVLRKIALDHPEYTFGRAVLLGPPNQGAIIAKVLSKYWIFNKVFGPNLKALGELELSEDHDIGIGVIAGGKGNDQGFLPLLKEDNDLTVRVSEAKLENMEDFYLLKFTHSILMYHPIVYKLSKNFIETGKFT